MRLFILFSCLILGSLNSTAQTKPETLTNASIISLHKAGLEDELILAKIESAPCKFDVSTNGMIALKNGGLSKEIIQAVMNKAEGKSAVVKKEPVLEKTTAKTLAGGKAIPEPETINYVNFYDKTAQILTPLERGSAAQKVEKKALGYGGADVVYELQGDRSTARAAADRMPSFVVNTGGGSADIFVLYKLDVKKGKRKAVVSHIGMGSDKGTKGIIPIDIKQLKTGVYELVPTAKLDKGEYFFAVKSATNATTTNADVYAFGVD